MLLVVESIGEGNGNPLQCSCLENPRDSGAWWAAVYGVTELDTTAAAANTRNKHTLVNQLCFNLKKRKERSIEEVALGTR